MSLTIGIAVRWAELVRALYATPAVLAMVATALAAAPAAYATACPDGTLPVVVGRLVGMVVVYLSLLVVTVVMMWSTGPASGPPRPVVNAGPAV